MLRFKASVLKLKSDCAQQSRRRNSSVAFVPLCSAIVLIDEAELLELSDPARRIALDHQHLMVEIGVCVGPLDFQHRVDGLDQLLRGGDGRPLVAAAEVDCLVIATKLAVHGADGS